MDRICQTDVIYKPSALPTRRYEVRRQDSETLLYLSTDERIKSINDIRVGMVYDFMKQYPDITEFSVKFEDLPFPKGDILHIMDRYRVSYGYRFIGKDIRFEDFYSLLYHTLRIRRVVISV